MTTERIQPVQAKELERIQLKSWLSAHGIKAVLFDLDDTLLETSAQERNIENSYVSYVAERVPSVNTEEMLASIRKFGAEAFVSHSVSQERWHAVVAHMAEKYGQAMTPVLYDAKKIIFNIYKTAPNLLPSAIETLDAFRASVPKMGVVTHAGVEWTNVKLDTHDLRKYFDSVTIADAFGNKGPEHWQEAMKALDVRPEEVLVIGDNLKGDILAAQSLGVKYAVLLPSPWAVYREGTVAQGTLRAERIADVIRTILSDRA